MSLPLIIRHLGRRAYRPVWEAMSAFTDTRSEDSHDELWLLEHEPVFTLGQAGKLEHVLDAGDIPLLKVDRGGQVTYHGPGQLIAYPLLDLRRLKLGVRELVYRIEQSVIDALAAWDIPAERRAGAPGVYVEEAKIAALGLKVRRGCCFHGLSFNVDMDLEPFGRINPCGYRGLTVTQVLDLGGPGRVAEVAAVWLDSFCRQFDFYPQPVEDRLPVSTAALRRVLRTSCR